MFTRHHSPRARLLAVIAAVLMVAAACSSTATDTTDATADGTAAETTESTDAIAEEADEEAAEPSADEPADSADETESEPAAPSEDTTDAAPADAGDSTVSAVVASDYLGSYELADEEYGTMVTVTVEGTTRTIASNSLPNHATGDFPNAGNPNEITEQDLNYEFTTEPVYTGNATFAQTSGVGVNGIAMEPGTGETVSCESGESYRIEALQDLYDLGLDVNNAHVQPGGQYHYHGLSQFLVDAFDTDEDLVHVGFAADGFLMYYSKSAAYDTGYELSTEARTGTNCTYRGETIEIDGTTPDGSYVSDWVHTDAGDLDTCMGTEINGEYAYVIGEAYPYISRCLNGEVSGGAGPGGAPPAAEGDEQAQGPGGDHPAEIVAAAEALGITADELVAELGPPPGDLEGAADALDISVDELTAALGQ